MHDLVRCVYTGIGAPGTDDPDGLAGNRAQRELQRILHGATRSLTLPAVKGGTAILQAE
jgi:hypothetical protein